MRTEHEPSCDDWTSKNAACGSSATFTPVGSSITIQMLAPLLYSPAAVKRASPESINVSSAENTSMFCTTLYLLPTTPITSLLFSFPSLITACRLGTG